MSSFDLILQSSGAFDWNQGLLVLAMTAVVLGGLVGMEAVHQGRRRARRASPSARTPLSPTAPFSPAPPAPAAIARQQQAMVAPAPPLNWRRAAWAGLVATAVMSALYYILAWAGTPKLDVAAMLASKLGWLPFWGWVVHFLVGIVLAEVYGLWFAGSLSGAMWLRGAVYGLLPFLAAQLVVVPLMGGGVFSSTLEQPVWMVALSLAGHVVYGAVVGWIYGPALLQEDASGA
ncbi:MAG TPA: DUF6789 family protein [Candidatus Bipolaricaulota bacterium]